MKLWIFECRFQNRRAKEKRLKKDLTRRRNWMDQHEQPSASSSNLKDASNGENAKPATSQAADEDDDEDDDAESASDSDNGSFCSGLQDSLAETTPPKKRHTDFYDSVRDGQQSRT